MGRFEQYPFDPSLIGNDELSAFARGRVDLELELLNEWMGNMNNFTDYYSGPNSPFQYADPVYLGAIGAQLGDRPVIDLGAGHGMPGYLREEMGIDRYVAVDLQHGGILDPEVGHPERVMDEALHYLTQQPDGSANVMMHSFLRRIMFGSNWLEPGVDRLLETHGPDYTAHMAKLGEFVRRLLGETHRVLPDDGRLVVSNFDYPELLEAAGFVEDENLSIGVGTDPGAMDIAIGGTAILGNDGEIHNSGAGMMASIRSNGFEMVPVIRVYEKVPR